MHREQRVTDFMRVENWINNKWPMISSVYSPCNVHNVLKLEFTIAPCLNTLIYSTVKMPKVTKHLKNTLLLCAV